MAYDPSGSSVVAFQKDPTKLVGTVSVASIDWGNSSIITVGGGTTGNSSVTAFQGGKWIVSIAAIDFGSSSIITVGGGTTGNSSVTAYQGGAWSTSITSGYLNVIGSILVAPVGGTPITSVVNTIPSSLMVGASVFGTVPVTQVTDPWKVNVPTPSYIAYQAAGSVLAVSGSFSAGNTSVSAYIESTNTSIFTLVKNSSIAVLQGTNPWVISNPSVTAFQGGVWATSMVGGPININSILGTYQEKNAVTASVFGIPALFKIDETNSVLSAISPQSPLPIRGSVTALQGTNPWITNAPGGSVLAVRTDNASIVAVLSNSSVAVLQGTDPWKINVPTPSLVMYQAAGSVLAVSGSFSGGNSSVQVVSSVAVAIMQGNSSVTGTMSVLGTVPVTQSGVWTTSLISTVPSSVIVGASIFGALPAGVAVLGSVAVLQGTSPWLITGSIAAALTSGSSIVGTYPEDAAHTTADKGLFVLGVRNDTMSSITSADGDYSPLVVGPVGENVIANSPITAWWQADTSIMANVSVQAKAGAGTSIFTYVTAVQAANVSPNNVYITFTGGLGGKSSVLGYVPTPANGGAVLTLPNAWKTGANMGVSASVSGMGSILLSLQGFTAKL